MEEHFLQYEYTYAEILASLSYALDLTSGHPMGHSQRTCLIALELGARLGLSAEQLSDLYFAILLKDSGCSSNAARMYQIFGSDELLMKRASRVTDWSNLFEAAQYAAAFTLPKSNLIVRAQRLLHIATHQNETSGVLIETRCIRGAQIARTLGLSHATAECIHSLDEHWDGNGQPQKLRGDAIPILARIACLAQTFEVFVTTFDNDAALKVIKKRSGTWFDPQLAKIAIQLCEETAFWQGPWQIPTEILLKMDLQAAVKKASDIHLDSICDVFAQIVDAKSSFTGEHSLRVGEYSMMIGHCLGIGGSRLKTLRRAALLHDVGKLAVSNAILDKPGKPTDDEWDSIKQHPFYTEKVLSQIRGFERIAEIAAAHHERLDGTGYFRGLSAQDLDQDMRILAVADVFDALSADRPYRDAMPKETILQILDKESGTALDAECIEALKQSVYSVPLLSAA